MKEMKEKEYIINKNKLKEILSTTSKRYDIEEKNLEFIGAMDYSDILEREYILVYFNILDKNHEKYKSTIVYEIGGLHGNIKR